MAAWVKLTEHGTPEYLNLDRAWHVWGGASAADSSAAYLVVEFSKAGQGHRYECWDPDDQAAILAVLDAECRSTADYVAVIQQMHEEEAAS